MALRDCCSSATGCTPRHAVAPSEKCSASNGAMMAVLPSPISSCCTSDSDTSPAAMNRCAMSVCLGRSSDAMAPSTYANRGSTRSATAAQGADASAPASAPAASCAAVLSAGNTSTYARAYASASTIAVAA